MCANYVPVTHNERLQAAFWAEGLKVDTDLPAYPAETWPGSLAPFVRRDPMNEGFAARLESGQFGLLPSFATDETFGRRTYNARSETVSDKPSFRQAWRRGQRCIVLAEAIYEPRWEGGRAVRWRIERADGAPLAIAGLWSAWRPQDQQLRNGALYGHGRAGPGSRAMGDAGARWRLSFTMLTVNADGHALMRRFHRPEEEKRMVAILDASEIQAWLEAPPPLTTSFLRRYPADALRAQPEPRVLAPRRVRAAGAAPELPDFDSR